MLSLITKKTRLIIFNSPGNPTGGVVPEKEFQKLADGLAKHPNVFILSDEKDACLVNDFYLYLFLF